MQTKPTLLILAAGMGSRFGGLKQVTPIGPSGETIMDYSIYDALRAGFGKIVFIIHEDFAEAFQDRYNKKLKRKIEIEYVVQEIHNLPKGFRVPEGREKPWGTAHAILMGQNTINEAFAVINADDFYGSEAFLTMAHYLKTNNQSTEYSMVAYQIKNTLSDFGSVSRGICKTDSLNYLTKITERTNIFKHSDKIFFKESDDSETILQEDTLVSMNFWGFKPSLFKYLEYAFNDFLIKHINDLKSEIYIPSVVFELIKTQKASVKVLQADTKWFGVTYKEDHPRVIKEINNLVAKRIYPENLWK